MAEQEPEQPTPTKDVRRGKGRWLAALVRKPATWAVGVVLVALAATFGSGLQSLFGGLLPAGWGEPGSGIDVVEVRRQPMSGPVLVPGAAGAGFSDREDARETVNDPAWQAEHEWYAVGEATWEITLVGRHADPVVITDLRPERTGPCTGELRQGTLVDDITQGEGSKIEMKAAIDAPVPRLTSAKDGSAYFDSGTVTLAKGETVIISIEVTSAAKTCRWVLVADYVDHGERKTMTLEAPGERPFAITGYAEDHPYALTWRVDCDHALTRADVLAGRQGRPACR